MINLIIKEFKVNSSIFSFRKGNVISSLLSVLLVGIMVAVSTTLYVLLYKKFDTYNASISFSTIYMFLLSVLTAIYGIFTARKVFFNHTDLEVTAAKPIDQFKSLVAKIIHLFLSMFIFEAIIFLPHYIAFGVVAVRGFSYYFMIFLSIMFHVVFDLAVALLLVNLVEIIHRFFKKHLVLKLIVMLVAAVGLTFLYGAFLNIFLNLINNSSLDYLFNDANIQIINKISNYLYADVLLSRSLFMGSYSKVLNYYLIALGAGLVGFLVVYLFYSKTLNLFMNTSKIYKKKPRKKITPTKALIKKEVLLLTRESGNLYNFSALIVVVPILTFIVLNGLNQALTSGIFSVYAAILPNFLNSVAILIVLLFSSLLTLNSANIMKSEQKTMRVVKTLPYDLSKQMYLKMGIIFSATTIANVLSLILLIAFKLITVGLFFFLLLAAILLNIALIILLFRSELKNFNKANNENGLTSLLAVLLPVVIVAFNLLSALFFQMPNIYLYLIDLAVILLLAGLSAIYLKSSFKKDIYELEVRN